MKAYIIRSERKISPFGEHPWNCLIANVPLRELQAKALKDAGVTEIFYIKDIGQVSGVLEEHLVLGDCLYFTPELLQEFISRARKRGEPATCALKMGVTTTRTAVTLQNDVSVSQTQGHVKYNLHYFPEVDGVWPRDVCTIEIESDEFFAAIPVPGNISSSGSYRIPMTDKFIISIDHWVNLWVAGIVTVLSDGARLQRKSKLSLLWPALKAGSFNKWRILSKLNKIGRNCDIHHTAYIEGSVIGDGVTIGAGAVIRESVIGDGVTINNGVVVEASVVGGFCTILDGHILYCVIYPSSFVFTGRISASLLGRNTFVGSGVTLTDFRFDGKNVTVYKDGDLFDSGNLFLGSCLGNGTYVGSGCVIAPGRLIPPGLRMALPKEKTICGSIPNKEARVV